MGKTTTDPRALEGLVERLRSVRADAAAAWGRMNAHEMLCHLGDSTASVLKEGDAVVSGGAGTGEAPSGGAFLRFVALRLPLPWPPGKIATSPDADPKRDGTKPTDFEADRRRAIEGLRAFAAAPAEALPPTHGALGRMSGADWHRWAWRHTDHHLRQFGA